MDNRSRYEKLLHLLSTKKILKNDPYGVASFVERLREELSHPTLARNTIDTILDKITREGRLPEETQRVFEEIRSGYGVLGDDNGKYSKSDIWGSNTNLWRYK